MFEELGEELIGEIAEKALNQTLTNIINELPNRQESTIANQIYIERTGTLKFAIITETPVWGWLDTGTGIYNPEHAGKGEGGRIVPIGENFRTGKRVPYGQTRNVKGEFSQKRKVLHFKNKELAMALGFPDENVFLASVKGIKPKWFFSRHIEGNRFNEVWNSVISETFI